jgi:hypothetical protein
LSSSTVTEPGAATPAGASSSFELLAFRFQFQAREAIYFPPGKAANTVRGAFGMIFRQLVCISECHEARACEHRAGCPYARIFEPVAAMAGPSGLRDWPRPFVFRAAHLDGARLQPGAPFYFDVHLFDTKDPPIVYFVLAFEQLVKQGLGPARGKARLVRVEQLDPAAKPSGCVFNGATFLMTELRPPICLDLQAGAATASKVEVRFTTPTELKHGALLATRPDFPVLLGRIRDRVSTLRALYGSGPLEIDFKELGERAAAVKMSRCDLRFSEAERRSAKTGERHPLGGFVGEVQYEGALGEFLPWLHAGWWVGVGRQTVWGKGVIEFKVLAE